LRFDRTPKRGDFTLARLARYRTRGRRVAALELLLLAYLLVCKLWFAQRTLLGELPFLSFFTFGLLAMSVPSLYEAWCDARMVAAPVRFAPPVCLPAPVVSPVRAP
jgi:hypothetical protein